MEPKAQNGVALNRRKDIFDTGGMLKWIWQMVANFSIFLKLGHLMKVRIEDALEGLRRGLKVYHSIYNK